MSCTDCTSNSFPVSVQSFTSYTGCECEDCGCNGSTMDAKCVFYTGPNLPCATINTNDSLEDILIKVDQKLCATLGDYSAYNKFCLDDSGAITSEEQFVEAISEYVCLLRSDLDTFINTTFEVYKGEVDARITDVENPGISCTSAGVLTEDSLITVLTKYCTKFAAIDTTLSLVGINWDSCFIVDPDPTTLVEAFNVLISQICTLSAGGGPILPTFNNIGTCLPGTLTATDSLEETINKIKDRLCELPTLDIEALPWGCTTQPSSNPNDLQGALSNILDKLTAISEKIPTFSADFTLAQVNVLDPCEGVEVSLSSSGLDDKWVAVDGADLSPGTLSQKLEAGTGITFDTVTTPGKLIISSSAAAATDTKVKTRALDPLAGYLEDKVEGGSASSGLTITVSTNTGNEKVSINSSINFVTFWEKLIEALIANPTTKEAFCEQVQSCLPDCIIPPNVTVIYQDTSQTTTSTTTTTTTTL